MAILIILFVGVVGCKDSEETSGVSPELAATISRIQADNGLSNDETSIALERWVEMYAGAKGLLESEDIFGGGSWTPERFAAMVTESEKALNEVRHEDQTPAAYSLGHLAALNEQRYSDIGESLRAIILRHYVLVQEDPNGVGESFIKAVEKIAETDAELKHLLE